ncbi:MAG: sulfatase [Bacteroidales bacterium]|nr:sulfatase [Bacteroidales bacterium]
MNIYSGTLVSVKLQLFRQFGFQLIAMIAVLTSCSGDTKKEVHLKPNILLICVDDLRPELSCFDSRLIQTPNIDRLASEARVFRRHYVQAAICGPSRSSMLSGQRINSWDCWKEARKYKIETERPVSFAQLFHRFGYRTICIGKVSHQPGGVMDEEQTLHEVPFSWDEAYTPVGQWETPWRTFFAYSESKAYNKAISMKKDESRLPYEAADVDDNGYPDGLIATAAIQQLQKLASSDQPFLLATGFYKPHLPFNAPKKYWDLIDREKIPLVENYRAPKNVDSAISIHNSYELTMHYHWPGGPGNISETEAQTLRHAYLACVRYADAQIGRVLDELRRLKLEDRTIVVLWSDHGYHLGEHGMFCKDTNYEIATRSPLIVRLPGMVKRGESTDAIVESIDLYPTLAELCGLEPPEDLQGKSFVELLDDPLAQGKEFAYSFHGRDKRMCNTVRTDRWRLIEWREADGRIIQTELYDHAVDPDENINVARYPDNREVVERLQEILNSVHYSKFLKLE